MRPVSNYKILIVEDEAIIGLDLSGRLAEMGYAITAVASSGEAALQHVKQNPPDLILMDIQLRGGMDGIETARQIHECVDIPIIYLSGFQDEDTLTRAAESQAYTYLFKPVRDNELRTAVAMALANHDLKKALEASEQRYRLLTEISSDWAYTFVVEPSGRVIVDWVADSFRRVTGYDMSELNAVQNWNDLLHPEDLPRLNQHLLALKSGVENVIEYRFITRDGTVRWQRDHARPVMDENGNLVRVFSAVQDITLEKSFQEEREQRINWSKALARVATRLNDVIDLQAVLAIVVEETASILGGPIVTLALFDEEHGILKNAATHGLGNHDLPESIRVTRQELDAFWGVDLHPVYTTDLNRLFRTPTPSGDSTLRPVAAIIAPIATEGKIFGTLSAIVIEPPRDFTWNEQSHLMALASQAGVAISHSRLFEQVSAGRERLQLLSRQLVEIQEAERRYLAHELHDEVGQILTGLQFSLQMAKSLSGEPLKESLANAQKLVADLIAQVRELSINLHPSMLDDMGLQPTLQWYFNRYTAQTGIRVNFSSQRLEQRFAMQIETTAYRIIQEALTNVARYAGVGEVQVDILAETDLLRLRVQDQGYGFEPDLITHIGVQNFGLLGIRERANLIGGDLTISSAPGAGTLITAVLPIHRSVERRKDDRKSNPGRRSSHHSSRAA